MAVVLEAHRVNLADRSASVAALSMLLFAHNKVSFSLELAFVLCSAAFSVAVLAYVFGVSAVGVHAELGVGASGTNGHQSKFHSLTSLYFVTLSPSSNDY